MKKVLHISQVAFALAAAFLINSCAMGASNTTKIARLQNRLENVRRHLAGQEAMLAQAKQLGFAASVQRVIDSDKAQISRIEAKIAALNKGDKKQTETQPSSAAEQEWAKAAPRLKFMLERIANLHRQAAEAMEIDPSLGDSYKGLIAKDMRDVFGVVAQLPSPYKEQLVAILKTQE